MDQRIQNLAKKIVNYSCYIQPGENVFIDGLAEDLRLGLAIIDEVYAAGGNPFFELRHDAVTDHIIKNCSSEQMELLAKLDLDRLKNMDAYIIIRSSYDSELDFEVPFEQVQKYNLNYMKVHQYRRQSMKWFASEFPNERSAKKANTSLEQLESIYLNACNADYEMMSEAADSLLEVMRKTDKVHLVGPGTDLTFSIAGIPSEKSVGNLNLPDGEIWSAPVRNSVNGMITYNTVAEYAGHTFENIRFSFQNGKIVEAECNNSELLNKILDTDEGARYIGEFAISVNPYITSSMNNIAYDEKIFGSIHLTPGNAYPNTDNGNRSAIHWDLVWIQRPEYGGGEIWFDDVLIRKDGLFVLDSMKKLNELK